MMILVLGQKVFSQELECGTTLPDGANQILIDLIPTIEAFTAAQANQGQSLSNVPVRFTAIQGTGGGFAFGASEANFALNTLNQQFAPAGLNFILCGDINDIFDDRLKTSDDVDQFLTSFSYASGTMEVYLKQNFLQPDLPALGMIPLSAYQSGNPNFVSQVEHENWIKLRSPGDLGVTFIHETGHHFGLLHTHHVVGNYTTPVLPTAQDHPYPVFIGGNNMAPWWWGRELVIRQDLDPNDPLETRPFKSVNSLGAGDLVEDTPADCNPQNQGVSIWPGCFLTYQNLDCSFNAAPAYVDYNGDPIYPPPAGLSLGHNFMSYWRSTCLNQFTQGQFNRVSFFNQTARQPVYATSKCGSFTDKVEFEGSIFPLHNVTVRVRHPDDPRKCNVTTSLTGNFSGLFHSDIVKVHTYHNGKKVDLENVADPLKIHYGHKKCEYVRGVNSNDLFLINQHILALQPLPNGYSIIAADATQNNSITLNDVVELRRMILWENYFIPGLEQPWKFIPEFIPQNFQLAFNQNPFALFAGGYLQQGWQYAAPDLQKRGFDGIKIGDVNSSWPTDPEPCMGETPFFASPGETPVMNIPSVALSQNQTFKLTFKVSDFSQISDFQLGIKLPFELFEFIDVTDNNLSNFSKEEAFGLEDTENDAVRLVWFEPTGNRLSLPNNSTLFSLIVHTKQPVPNLNDVLQLDNFVLQNMFSSLGTTEPILNVEVNPLIGFRNTVSQTAAFQIMPNPVEGFLEISLLSNELLQQEIEISLYDIHGKCLKQLIYPSASGVRHLIDLHDLPSGVYHLHCLISGIPTVYKLVKV